jgi:WD40 repeat protein
MLAKDANNKILLFDLRCASNIIAELGDHRGPVCSLAAFPNGMLASSDTTGIMRTWDLRHTHQCVMESHVLDGKQPTSMAVAPDGRLAAAYSSGRVYMWE